MPAVDVFKGLLLDCSECDGRTTPTRRSSDPTTVVRCLACGKKHSQENLRYVGGL